MDALTAAMRPVISEDVMPAWTGAMPDSLTSAAAHLLPQLKVGQKVPSASVHATCSMQRESATRS